MIIVLVFFVASFALTASQTDQPLQQCPLGEDGMLAPGIKCKEVANMEASMDTNQNIVCECPVGTECEASSGADGRFTYSCHTLVDWLDVEEGLRAVMAEVASSDDTGNEADTGDVKHTDFEEGLKFVLSNSRGSTTSP